MPDPAAAPAATESHMPGEPTFLESELLKAVKRALEDANVNTKDMLRYMLAMEKSATARGEANVRLLGEIKTALVGLRAAVGEVDAGLDVVAHAAVDAKKGQGATLFSQVTGYLDKNKELKAAVFSAVINLLGLSGLAGTAYATFRVVGIASTPTPVQVVAPPQAADNGPALLP